jgi:hypothetical protein
VRFADIGGNGGVAGKNKKCKNRRTKKRFHGGSLLCFSFEIFWVKTGPLVVHSGVLKRGVEYTFDP